MITISRARTFLTRAPAEAAGDAIGLIVMVALVILGFTLPAVL